MGHCIQAIVTTSDIAESLRTIYPQLPGVKAPQGYVILPVDGEFIDDVTEARLSQSTGTFILPPEAFMLLTETFHSLLRDLSRFGPLAYIETDYFGGVGAQGAAVYSGREVVMELRWRNFGPVNQALKLIGVKRRLLGDRFSALGLYKYRLNEDLIDAAASDRHEHHDK